MKHLTVVPLPKYKVNCFPSESIVYSTKLVGFLHLISFGFDIQRPSDLVVSNYTPMAGYRILH